MDDLRKKTISGFIYKFLERIGAKGVSIVVSILLARLILPEEYGLIALVYIFIIICDVFVSYGFGSSLIANKDSDDTDFSTCFFFGLFCSLLLYVAIYFAAPIIAGFYSNYNYDMLIMVLRVMALRIPIAAINTTQHAYVAKHLMFKKFFYATLIGTVVSGIIAVVMAFYGFGVWALVEQYIGNVCLDTICLFVIVNWRPKFLFSAKRLKIIYSYGWKILAVGLIDKLYSQSRSLVIGKMFSPNSLAFYSKGQMFPSSMMEVVEQTISGVVFPALSLCNDDRKEMRSATRRIIKTSSYLMFPVVCGIALTGKEMILLLLTDKWIGAVPFLYIACLAYILRPIQLVNDSLIKASGRSDLLLKLNILKKGIGIILLITSIHFGVIGIAFSYALTNIIATIINIFPNRKLIDYGYIDQLKDVMSNIFVCLIMCCVVFFVGLIPISSLVAMMFIKTVAGVFVYLGVSFSVKNESFTYLKNLLINHMQKK